MILLDITLLEKNGYEICTEIRSFSKIPIIFVTSKNTAMNELNSIMLEKDDFITKPYNIPILLARVHALMRRAYPGKEEEMIEYQGITLFIERNIVSYRKKETELSKTELWTHFYGNKKRRKKQKEVFNEILDVIVMLGGDFSDVR